MSENGIPRVSIFFQCIIWCTKNTNVSLSHNYMWRGYMICNRNIPYLKKKILKTFFIYTFWALNYKKRDVKRQNNLGFLDQYMCVGWECDTVRTVKRSMHINAEDGDCQRVRAMKPSMKPWLLCISSSGKCFTPVVKLGIVKFSCLSQFDLED